MPNSYWERVNWIHPESLPVGLTHLSLPVCVEHPVNGYVLFATARDENHRSHVVAARLDGLNLLAKISVLDWRTILAPGKPGHFDEAGVVMSDVWLDQDSQEFHGFVFGWRLRFGGGWFNLIGKLRMNAALELIEYGPADHPRVDTFDPISIAYASRVRHGDSIVYSSTQLMDAATGAVEHYRVHETSIANACKSIAADPHDLGGKGIFAYSRPFGLSSEVGDHLWVSERGDHYSIRYLFRPVGTESFVDGNEMLSLMPSGRDGEIRATCYASILTAENQILMLYNGDGFGKTGVGVAQLSNGVLEL